MKSDAQTHYDSRIHMGVHGGVNFSEVSFTPGIRQLFLTGFNCGFNFRYVEERHFGLIAELNCEQRGWKEDFGDEPYKYSRTANYLQIPVLAHIYFGTRGRFFINAGPSVSFLISETNKRNFPIGAISSASIKHTAQHSLPIKAKTDYGITGGIGGEFGVNPKNSIYLDARFYYGLANLVKSGRTDPIRGANPMTISISIGYWYRLK